MPVHAKHLVEQQLDRQRVAPDQQGAQELLDQKGLRRLDRPKQA